MSVLARSKLEWIIVTDSAVLLLFLVSAIENPDICETVDSWCWKTNTVKLLNFLTPGNFTVITLKFEGYDVDGMTNGEDPNQTAPAPKSSLIWVFIGFPDHVSPKNLGSLQFFIFK